jgi:RNA polymerase sigma-70 factor (ECF subfamily)
MNEQEEIWVREARAGNKQAFNRLVEAYQRPVYNLTYRMLGNAQEAEDAAQETFLRAFARLKQFDENHKFSTWVFSIANHHCIDRLRKRHGSFVSIDDNPVLQNLEEATPQPEANILDEEQTVELQKLLNRLDPDYRTPLILRYWEDYSYEQIADTLGLTVPAVKSRLFRARKQMADLYREFEVAVTPPSAGARPTPTSQPSIAKRQVQPMLFRLGLAGI